MGSRGGPSLRSLAAAKKPPFSGVPGVPGDSTVPDASGVPDASAAPGVPVVPAPSADSAASAASKRHIQNIRNIIEANNGWAKVKRVEDINPYISKLQQFANDTPIHIDAPKNSKGKQECPTTNGVSWTAHRKPEPDMDKLLGQQWSITRKDYQGKNTQLFCYPPEGTDFAGAKITISDKNPAENLDLFAYTSPGDVTESLQTLVDMILPNSSITKVDETRAMITNAIIDAQNNSKLNKAKKTGIEQLAGILGTCQHYAGKSRQAREIATKKQAKNWINIVHNIAVANVGLNDLEEPAARKQCLDNNLGSAFENKFGVFACVPGKAITEQIMGNSILFSKVEKDKVKNYLVKYSKHVVQLQESSKQENWETAFFNLTKDQRNKKWLHVRSPSPASSSSV